GQPIFESQMAYENHPLDSALIDNSSWLDFEDVRYASQTNYPLTFAVIPGPPLQLSLFYDAEQFDCASIRLTLRQLEVVLRGLVIKPDQVLRDVSLLTDGERQQLLVEWNDTAADYPRDQCIHQMFEEQARRTPEAMAVVFEDRQLSYAQLNARANQLAHHLRRLGVGPEVLVGICVERSLEMVVGLLGILKAGGAYLAVGSGHPAARRAFD